MSRGGAAAFMFACGLLGRKGLAHGGTPAALLRKLKAESFVVDALLFLLFSHLVWTQTTLSVLSLRHQLSAPCLPQFSGSRCGLDDSPRFIPHPLTQRYCSRVHITAPPLLPRCRV